MICLYRTCLGVEFKHISLRWELLLFVEMSLNFFVLMSCAERQKDFVTIIITNVKEHQIVTAVFRKLWYTASQSLRLSNLGKLNMLSNLFIDMIRILMCNYKILL